MKRLHAQSPEEQGLAIEIWYTSHIGKCLVCLQQVSGHPGNFAINPPSYTTTSAASLDRVLVAETRLIQVHVSDINEFDEVPDHSRASKTVIDVDIGLGIRGQVVAPKAMADLLEEGA